MILLDTSALVSALTTDGPARTQLRAALADGHRIVLSSLVLYEWLRGPRVDAELAAQEALFPSGEALVFGPDEGRIAAELYRALPRGRGREIDLAIAATALAHRCRLWTSNSADFEDVPGLELYRPE